MNTPADSNAQAGQQSTESRLRSELAHIYHFKEKEHIGTDFIVIKPLGYGGFAEVYLCTQKSMDRQVAVKVFTQTTNEFNEAKVAGKLDHPNIVPIHSTGRLEDETPYIVYKYIDGNTLESHLEETTYRRMSLNQETFAIIKEIAEALDYAHSQGTIHRDVKPSNIILDKNGKAYLTDFGLGEIKQVAEEGEKRSAVSRMLESRMAGTVPYMAPEQLEGISLGDQATDLYSFGVVVYEMLTGQLPYHKAREAQLIIQIASKTAKPLPPNVANPELPEGIGDIILKMLSKDPTDRHPTAVEFVNKITHAAQSYITANTQYQKATEAIDAEDWRRAQEIFAKMQKETPGHKDVPQQLERVEQKVRLLDLYDEAKAYVDQKKYQEALEKIDLIQQLDPNYEVSELRKQAIHGRSEQEKRTLSQQYEQAQQQFAANNFKGVLDTLAIIHEKQADYPDPDKLQEQAQEKVDYQNNLRHLYNQGVEFIRQEAWAEALETFQELADIDRHYEDVDNRLTMISHFYDLSTLFQEAEAALQEQEYATCFKKLHDIETRNEKFKPDLIKSKRAEAVQGLLQHIQQLLRGNRFQEGLTAVALLKQQQPDHPDIEALTAEAQTGLANQQLTAELDDLYGRAEAQLNQGDYAETLNIWADIQTKKNELAYPDIKNISSQAKLGMYNNAFVALTNNNPQKALALWEQLRKYDPHFNDSNNLVNQANELIRQANEKLARNASLRQWGMRIGGGFILLVFLLFGGRACYNSVVGAADEPTPTPTLQASQTATTRPQITPSATPSPTHTPKPPTPTSTAVPPSPTVTRTPSPTPTQPPTATPTPPLEATAVLPASILEQPETGAAELDFVAIGETVTILGITPNGHWLWIRSQNDIEGFVAADRFEFNDTAVPTVIASEISPTPQGQATALDAVTLYCDHGDMSSAIKDLRINTTVQVIGRSANLSWLYIQDPTGSEGFVSARFFDFPNNTISALPVREPSDDCENSSSSANPPSNPSSPASPIASGKPLTLDIWNVGPPTCQGGIWTVQIYMQGQGGNGRYTYYWNGQRQGGPINNSITFTLSSAQGSPIGKARVESGDGQQHEVDFYVPSVDCSNS